ncbi:MAG: hypothetical protein K6F28_11360, partial [Lachnospiraceae bacterium]|nr:hypothetical protein [Lachnospiraceae bacterium]
MSKRRNWLKITIAMITLIATVLETGFTTVSTMAAETVTEDGIVVDTDAVDGSEQSADDGDVTIDVVRDDEEQPADEDKPADADQPAEEGEQPADEDKPADADQPAEEGEQPADEDQPAEEGEQPADEDQPAEEGEQPADEDQPAEEGQEPSEEGDVVDVEEPAEGDDVVDADQPAEEEAYEEAEELKEGELDITDDGIYGSGYDEISIYVNTDNLANKDRFRLEFTGPDSASYNPVINDDLDRTNGGRYDFENLEGGDFTVRANSSENVILSYKYNEDGYPMIVLESKAVEKVLETKTLSSLGDSEIQAISGEGYDSITVNFNTEELSDTAAFRLIVESDAEATVDGADARAGIRDLDRNTGSLTIEGLDQENFTAYVLSDKDDVKIKTIANIDSVEDGVAVFTVDNVDTKRVYEYEDSKVKVTAVLDKADAVPDDAYFDVTPLTEEEAEKYLAALNENKGEGDVLATADNTLLYDIGFYTDESKSEEIEPEEGSVRISIEFKRDQLAEEIGAENEEDIVVAHITEEGSKLTTEEVEAEASVDGGTVDFTTETFSIYAIHNKSLNFKSGTPYSYTDILGQAVNYGFVAGTYQSGSHVDSNFATKTLTGSAQITAGKYTGNGNPGNYIIGDYNDTGFWVDASKTFIIYVDKDDKDNFNSNMDSRPVIYNTDYTTEQLQSQVDSLITGTKSSTLYSETNNNTGWLDKIYGSDQKYHLDLTQYPGGTYYFMFGKDEFPKISQADKLRVYINSDQNVVFNIPDTSVNVEKFLLSIDGNDKYSDASDSSTDPYCRKVVFNMPNATKVNLSGVFGIFLAPKADVNIGTTSTGWLVCGGKFTNNGEWHGTWQDMPETFGTSTQFFAKKTVNNNPPAADEVFSFELYTYDFTTGYSSKPVQTKQNAGELITFDPINYSYDEVKNAGGNKVYAYKIVEKATDKQGYTIDTAEYIIHVKVRVDGQNLTIYEKNVYKGKDNKIGNDYTQNGT